MHSCEVCLSNADAAECFVKGCGSSNERASDCVDIPEVLQMMKGRDEGVSQEELHHWCLERLLP